MAINPNTPATLYAAFANHAPAVQQALIGGAQDLFAGLVLIEFVIVVGWLFLQKTDLIDILAVILRLTIGFGFWLFMLQNWVQFGKAIIDTFGMWGNSAVTAAGGTANMDATGFLMAGVNMAHHLWDAFSVAHLLTGILMALAGTLVLYVSGKIASEIMLVVIETFLVSYLGTVLMAFGAMGYTRDYANSQVRYAVSVGVKRMTLQVIAGLGEAMVTDFAQQIQASNGTVAWLDLATIIGGLIVIYTLAEKAPKIAQDMIMGNHLTTPGGLLSTAREFATTAASVAAAAAGGVGAMGAAGKLAGAQMAASAAAGQGPASLAGRAATFAGMTTKNLASAAASDVGKRLSGARSSRHGYMGFRMASDLKEKKENL